MGNCLLGKTNLERSEEWSGFFSLWVWVRSLGMAWGFGVTFASSDFGGGDGCCYFMLEY